MLSLWSCSDDRTNRRAHRWAVRWGNKITGWFCVVLPSTEVRAASLRREHSAETRDSQGDKNVREDECSALMEHPSHPFRVQQISWKGAEKI